MQNDQSLLGAADGVPRCRNYRQMTVTEQGLVLGAGTLLAKMGDDGLCLDGEEERILTLLAIAYRGDVPGAALGMFRRVSKHWQGGEKCLAAVHLAQCGLPEIDEDAATCLSLAAELIEAGMTPRELARELGLRPVQFDVSKYDENQPRVPAGNGRESGQWTSGDAAGEGENASLVEGRSAGTASGVHQVWDLPEDAVMVARPDGSKIFDPGSPTKRLMAPPRANFQEVFAAGESIANWPISDQLVKAKAALEQFGTYDFQRDRATNTWFSKYVLAANYAVGVYMAGAGYGELASVKIAQTWGFFTSSTRYSSEAKEWTERGWEHARRGDWKTK